MNYHAIKAQLKEIEIKMDELRKKHSELSDELNKRRYLTCGECGKRAKIGNLICYELYKYGQEDWKHHFDYWTCKCQNKNVLWFENEVDWDRKYAFKDIKRVMDEVNGEKFVLS